MKHIILQISLFILIGISINAQSDFAVNLEEEHSFLILPNKVIDYKEYVGAVTKYVWKYHAKDRLKINNIEIGGENDVLIQITQFRNQSHAMSFYNHMKRTFPDFMHMGMTKAYFPVSKSNFDEILRKEGVGEYEQFFETNILTK
mgnify:CR=1 FL=1